MDNINDDIRNMLFEKKDQKYKEFVAKLTPNISSDSIIGVRTPELRKMAAQLAKRDDTEEFLSKLPHKYYEENNLHGFLIERIKDYRSAVDHVDMFLPYVDNWATCDLMSPKVFKKNADIFIEEIKRWILSPKTYTIRFGIEMLMSFYLDDLYKPEYPAMVAVIRSEEYYVNMMIAWYFATALAKQYETVLPFIKERRLSEWTHNKTIQKACESYRISEDKKKHLKSLKIR